VKTRGEIEAEISKGVNQIYAGLLGRGAKEIKTNIIGANVLVVLQNVLTAAELSVVKTTEGRKIIKEMCCAVVEHSRAQFQMAVVQATARNVIDIHHDISTATGREILVFSLSDPPTYRKPNGK
jgi:uncharacterized protein YbcI